MHGNESKGLKVDHKLLNPLKHTKEALRVGLTLLNQGIPIQAFFFCFLIYLDLINLSCPPLPFLIIILR